MKVSKLYLFGVVVCSILISIFGFIYYFKIYPLLFTLINPSLIVDGSSNFWRNLIWILFQIFPYTILPFAFLFVVYKSNPNTLRKKIVTMGIIVTGAIFFLFIRILMLRFNYRNLGPNLFEQNSVDGYMIEHTRLYFELFEILGIIAGTYISISIFKRRT